jgi:hypothetical protein
MKSARILCTAPIQGSARAAGPDPHQTFSFGRLRIKLSLSSSRKKGEIMSEGSVLVGRDDLVSEVVREIRKGKHLVLTGPVGIGKSAVLQAALKRIEPRPSEWYQFDPVAYDAGELDACPAGLPEDPGRKDCILVYLSEHQAKGQFVQMARRLARGERK